MTAITSYSNLAAEYIASSTTSGAKEGDALLKQQAHSAEVSHGGVRYSTREENSKSVGKYTRITVRDPSFRRRHRYFFSFIKAIGSMFSRLRRTGSVKTYLGGRTAHLRSRLPQDDRIALAATKVCGTLNNESLPTVAATPTSSGYGINTGPIFIASKSSTRRERGDLGEKVANVVADFNKDLVVEKGFYEIQLSTAVVGTFMTEPHQVSFIIDPHRKQFYLVDSKGMKPEKLAFYNHLTTSPVDVNVADFINELRTQERFKDYDLVTTPEFQGAGDCVAASEAVSRSLSVVRMQLIDLGRLDAVDKHYEIETAIGMVHENYDQTVTDDIRAKLEDEIVQRRRPATVKVQREEVSGLDFYMDDDGFAVV